MIPLILFPLLGVLATDQTCMMYMKEPTIMYIGGIILSLAVEYCGLHKRLALKLIPLIGCSHRRLSFGSTMITMFVSMWMSNTAAIALMCPIIKSALEELESHGLCRLYDQQPLAAAAAANVEEGERMVGTNKEDHQLLLYWGSICGHFGGMWNNYGLGY